MPDYGEAKAALEARSFQARTHREPLSGEEREKELRKVSAEGLKADMLVATPEWSWFLSELQEIIKNAEGIVELEARRMAEGPVVNHEQLISMKIRANTASTRAAVAKEMIDMVKKTSEFGQKAKAEISDLTSV